MSEQFPAASLFKSYEKCLATLIKRDAVFTMLSSIHPPELIAKWECMNDVPKLVNGKVCSMYEVQFQDSVYRIFCIVVTYLIFSVK